MIPHKCRFRHDPPDSYGDCSRAVLASLLNFERIEDVPHFLSDGCEPEEAHQRIKSWLYIEGYKPFMTFYPGNVSVDEVFAAMKIANPDIPYLLYCQCGGDDHVVICRDDQVIHDPAWYVTPISGPHSNGVWAIMVLVPLSLCK